MRRICLLRSVLASSLLTGCSLLSPPRSESVTAVLSKVPDHVPRESGHASTLLVLLPETSPIYDTTRMAYSERSYQLAFFRDNEWGGTPAQMIQPLLVQTLQQTGFFRAILSPPESGSSSYALRTQILELVQDHTVTPPVLRLALRLQLFDASGRPVAGREITEQETMRDTTPYAGVIAANDALAKALGEAAQFVMKAAR
jgi:cholesterol transport system auxiliary component